MKNQALQTLQTLLEKLRSYLSQVKEICDTFPSPFQGEGRYVRYKNFCDNVQARIKECYDLINKCNGVAEDNFTGTCQCSTEVSNLDWAVNRSLGFDFKRIIEEGPFINRLQAVEKLQATIDTINGYKEQAVKVCEFYSRGKSESSRNAAQTCRNYVGRLSDYISKYLTEKSHYEKMSDEDFFRIHPTTIFRGIAVNLNSLKLATQSLLASYPIW